jgi:antitoxin component YwqK of YwqJK toxin-antitoxin module
MPGSGSVSRVNSCELIFMRQSLGLLVIFIVSSFSVCGQDSPSIHIDTIKMVQKPYQRGESVNGKFLGYRTYYSLEESYRPQIGYNRIIRDNGSVYFEGEYILVDTVYKRVGLFKFYSLTGQLDYEQDFNTNQRINYFDNGIKKSEGLIDDLGKRTGIWTCYYSSGQIKSKGEAVGELKKGTWEYYNNWGKLKKKIEYKALTGTSGNQDCCDW